MTNYRIQHCPKIGASFTELGGYSASELRVWQNQYLNEQLADEAFAELATWSFHPIDYSYLRNNQVSRVVPLIGASWTELNGKSESDSRTFWNESFAEQLQREGEAVKNRPHALDLVREPYKETPIEHNPLLDIIDEANKTRIKATKKELRLN